MITHLQKHRVRSKLSAGYNHFIFENSNELFSVGLESVAGRVKSLGVESVAASEGGVKKFSSGKSNNIYFLTGKGYIYARGFAGFYQFGDGEANDRPNFERIKFYDDKKVKNFFATATSFWVILKNNKVYRNGSNVFGELGTGDDKIVATPQELDTSFFLDKDEQIVQIRGCVGVIMLTNKGRVYTTSPKRCFMCYFTPIKQLSNIKDFDCGSKHSLFATLQGHVWGSGSNNYGQLGLGNRVTWDVISPPERIMELTDVVKVRAGLSHSLFLTKDGSVYACGVREGYQPKSIITRNNRYVSVPIKFNFWGVRIIDIHAMCSTSIFISSTGSIISGGDMACGNNVDYTFQKNQCLRVCIKHKAEIAIIDHPNPFRKVTWDLIDSIMRYSKTDVVVLT